MATYNIYEAKTSFSKLVAEAAAGKEVVIAKAGAPLVKMVPVERVEAPKRRRKFGDNFLGITYIAPDFYDDLPLEMWDVLRDSDDVQGKDGQK
jgi:prevent-host-death family protein